MPRYIPPIKVPRPVPQPSTDKNVDPTLRLDASELFIFDIAAKEPVDIAGTECELFQRDLSKSNIDPLYREPIQNTFVGPYLLLVQVEWPEFTPEATEAGMRALWPSGAWIPRATIEQVGARGPREGDVLRFWKLPYFDQQAALDRNVPGGGFYFDIIKTNDDGHLHDSPAFVGFRCDLKRRSNFGPEQQFIPPKVPTDECE